jgi:hypothetical protein
MSPEDEANMLKREAASLSNNLDALRKRIEELEKEATAE